MIDEEDVFSCKGDNSQVTTNGDTVYNVISEESESFSSQVHLDKLGRGNEDLRFVHISCIDNFPLTQSLESNEFEDVFLDRVDTEVASTLAIKIESRESFTFLCSKAFYSLYLDPFDGLMEPNLLMVILHDIIQG